MGSLAERRAAVLAALVLAALVLAACTVSDPAPGTLSPSPSTTSSVPSADVASAEPTAEAVMPPEPGRPWDGAAVLEEMRDSTRPGGVPADVRTPAIAEELARAVWTVDGAAWDTAAIGGFCGTSTCTIDLAGTHLGRAGEDLWTIEVDLGSGTVTPIATEVRSLPWDLVDEIDRLARSLDEAGSLGPMQLTTARWLPPPEEPGRFVLSYRSGGEEGACARDLLLDAARGEIVEESATGC